MQPQERNHDSFSKTVMNPICQELVYRWVSNPVTARTEETFPLIINWRWQRRASVLAARWGRAKVWSRLHHLKSITKDLPAP